MNSATARAEMNAARGSTAMPTRAWRVVVVIFQILVVWLSAILVMPWISRQHRRRMNARFARRMIRSLGVRVQINGVQGSAAKPTVFVANHVSWLDPHLLNLIAGARFIAKEEVASYPLCGTIVRQFGAIFIRRGNYRDAHRVKGEAAASLKCGEHVAFFPEGTTSDGSLINYFYPALFQAAVDARATVQPIAIRYHHADGRLNLDAGFIDDMTIVESIRLLLKYPVIHVSVTLCEPLEADDVSRLELANRSRAMIAAELKLAYLNSRPVLMPWERLAEKRERERDPESPISRSPARVGS